MAQWTWMKSHRWWKCFYQSVFSWKWGWMVGRSEFDQEAHQNLSPRPWLFGHMAHVYANSRISIEFTQTHSDKSETLRHTLPIHERTHWCVAFSQTVHLLFKSTAGMEGIGSTSKSFSVQRCSLFLCQKGCMDRSFTNLWWMLAWNWSCCSCFCLCTSN